MFGKVRTCVLNMPMNEGQGHPHDSSGYGNIGINNGADWVSGDHGWAMEFVSANTDYVECGNETSLDFGIDSFAVSFWFKASSTGWQEIIGKRGDSSHYWGCFDGGTNLKIRWRLQGSAAAYVTATQPEVVFTGDWCHAVWVVDRIQHKSIWYFDGVKSATDVDISSLTGMSFDSTSLVRIGRTDTTNYFNGSIAGVRIYNRPLSAAEILSEYNATQTKYQSCVLNMPMNEGQGHPHDSSGYGNNGTNHGADWVSGDYGWALDLNGTSDYISCGNHVSLNPTDEITTMCYFYPKNITDTQRIFNKYTAALNRSYSTVISANKIRAEYWDSIGTLITPPAEYTIPSTDIWYHYASVFDGTSSKIYINGNLEENETFAAKTLYYSATDLEIGRFTGSNIQHFNGPIDQVRVYNRALSAAEILAYFNTTKARYGL